MRSEIKIFFVKNNVFKEADYQLQFENIGFPHFFKRGFLKIVGPNTSVLRFFAENSIFSFENGGPNPPNKQRLEKNKRNFFFIRYEIGEQHQFHIELLLISLLLYINTSYNLNYCEKIVRFVIFDFLII